MTHSRSSAINTTRKAAFWQREFTNQPDYRPELRYDDSTASRGHRS